jgi:hypothetical protein
MHLVFIFIQIVHQKLPQWNVQSKVDAYNRNYDPDRDEDIQPVVNILTNLY